SRPKACGGVAKVVRLSGEVLARFHRPHQVKGGAGKTPRLGVGDFESAQRVEPGAPGVVAGKAGLFLAECEPVHAAAVPLRQVGGRAAVSAADVEHVLCLGQVEQRAAVVEQRDLRLLRRFRAGMEQPVMDVVAPERPVDERQRIVVLADLFGGGHQQANLAGENAVMSSSVGVPAMTCASTRAVTGASRIPLRKWPVAAKYRGSDVAPRIGSPSGVPGRRPAHASRMRASPSDGTRLAADWCMRWMTAGSTRLSKPASSTVAPISTRPSLRGTR